MLAFYIMLYIDSHNVMHLYTLAFCENLIRISQNQVKF